MNRTTTFRTMTALILSCLPACSGDEVSHVGWWVLDKEATIRALQERRDEKLKTRSASERDSILASYEKEKWMLMHSSLRLTLRADRRFEFSVQIAGEEAEAHGTWSGDEERITCRDETRPGSSPLVLRVSTFNRWGTGGEGEEVLRMGPNGESSKVLVLRKEFF